MSSSVVEVLPSSDDDEVYASSSPQSKAPADAAPNANADVSGADTEPRPEAHSSGGAASPAAAASDAAEPADDEDSGDDDAGERVVDLEKCLRLKNAGNALYTTGDIAGALAQYRRAMRCAAVKPRSSALPPSDADATAGETSADVAAGADAAGADATDSAATDGAAPENDSTDKTDYSLTAQVYCNAGLCLMKLQLFDEAVDALSEALRHDSSYQKAYLRRAECYYELNKWSSAYVDYESYTKLGGQLDAGGRAKMANAKTKMDEEMQKMMGDLKEVGNKFLGLFGLSTDNFKFDKDPNSGGYSMRFER